MVKCFLSVDIGVLPFWHCVERELDTTEQVQNNAQASGTRGNTVEQERCPNVSLQLDNRWLCLLLHTRWQCFPSVGIGVLPCWHCVERELDANEQVQNNAQASGTRGNRLHTVEQVQCSTRSVSKMIPDGCVCC